MLTIADVSKSYGTRELFAEVSLFIARTDRLGLVGPGGAGNRDQDHGSQGRPESGPASTGRRRVDGNLQAAFLPRAAVSTGHGSGSRDPPWGLPAERAAQTSGGS